MTNTERIKDCPFCGAEYGELTGVHFGSFPDSKFKIGCINCSVTMTHDRRDKVIAFWNQRKGGTDD